MKKKQIVNLIKYHVEEKDLAFRDEASQIASYFDSHGDHELAAHIMMLLSNANVFEPQGEEGALTYCKKIDIGASRLLLPSSVNNDIIGVMNAIRHGVGVNKFLFEGAPGTGKTESVKQMSRILERELFVVNFEELVDSKLGKTAQNISLMFSEINHYLSGRKAMVLFDEIDGIALDRIQKNDLREMGRATTAVLKGLDCLNDGVVLIATTNLFSKFDKALSRRFDAVINFDRYTHDDLVDIAISVLEDELKKFKSVGRNKRLFIKIMNLIKDIPNPGELRNMLRTALAFSDPSDEFDYLKRLLGAVKDFTAKELKQLGFTVREIETLTGISKSQVSRELSGLEIY